MTNRPTTNSAGPDPDDDLRRRLEDELGRILHGWRWSYRSTPELHQIEEFLNATHSSSIGEFRRRWEENDRWYARRRAQRDMKSMITVTVLPQENDRFVCKVGSAFAECTSYGKTEQEAISNALERYAKLIRDWKAE